MTTANALARPHTKRAAPPTGTRVGGLVWWEFHDSAADIVDLARAAMRTGYPPIFLPLPHPVSHRVAFGRMVRAGGRVLDGDRWHTDRIRSRDAVRGALPPTVRDWIEEARQGRALVAAVSRWEPRPRIRRPWHVRLWVRLLDAPGAEYLPTMKVVSIVIMVRVVKGEDRELDVTDAVVKLAAYPDDPDVFDAELQRLIDRVDALRKPQARADEIARVAGILKMAARLYHVLDRERTLATSPEIGDGVKAALESVGAVKLRAGLFVVPGERGLARAEETVAYLHEVPGCETGLFDLYAKRGAATMAALVRPLLLERVEALREEVRELDLDKTGVGALRTLWLRLDAEAKEIELNAGVLGRQGTSDLKEILAEARRDLQTAAEEKAKRLSRPVDLSPEPTAAAVTRLGERLRAIRLGGEEREQAVKSLRRGRSTLRSLACATMLKRLARLSDAVAHASLSAAHSHPERRAKVLGEALDRASSDAEKECIAARL